MAEEDGGLYFFLYPAGHLGLTAVTFLVTLPLVQVIVEVLSKLLIVIFPNETKLPVLTL